MIKINLTHPTQYKEKHSSVKIAPDPKNRPCQKHVCQMLFHVKLSCRASTNVENMLTQTHLIDLEYG